MRILPLDSFEAHKFSSSCSARQVVLVCQPGSLQSRLAACSMCTHHPQGHVWLSRTFGDHGSKSRTLKMWVQAQYPSHSFLRRGLLESLRTTNNDHNCDSKLREQRSHYNLQHQALNWTIDKSSKLPNGMCHSNQCQPTLLILKSNTSHPF